MWLVPEVMFVVLAGLILLGYISGPSHRTKAGTLLANNALDQAAPNVLAAGAGAIAHAASNTGAAGSGMKTELDNQGIGSTPRTS